MATIRDVARIAGTSAATVSAVLNRKGNHNIRVGSDTRERILTAAAELGYVPNPIAQSLVTRKTGVIGLVFPYSGAFTDRNPFSTQVMSGVFEGVVRAKYNLMHYTAVGDEWGRYDVNALLEPRVDGLILAMPEPRSEVIRRCQERGFPCVALLYEPCSPDICAINADDFDGGLKATRHLIAQGHRRIAHLVGSERVSTTEPRKGGYLAALEEAGLAPDPALLIPAGFSYGAGYENAQRLLDLPAEKRPTAVFAANDLCADGAMKYLAEQGVLVPDDIAFVGFDDTWYATMTQPPLTSVHVPIAEMGAMAAEMLIALVEGREVAGKQPVLPVSLTVRASSGS